MDFQFDQTATGAAVTLCGRLTFAENSAFRRVVDSLRGAGGGAVVFDLGRLEYIDSAGLGMLLIARDTVAGRGGRAELVNATGQVGRIIDLARFHDIFSAAN